jgi:hypothetical protein
MNTQPIEETLTHVATKEIIKLIISKLPFVSFGPLQWLVSKGVFWIVEKLITNTALGINLYLLDKEIDTQRDRLKAAIEKAKQITGEESPEVLDAIDQEISNAARELIDLSRSRASN